MKQAILFTFLLAALATAAPMASGKLPILLCVHDLQ